MRSPKEVLQREIDDMTLAYARLLKNRPNKGKSDYEQSVSDRQKINARINEFNNAISKIS